MAVARRDGKNTPSRLHRTTPPPVVDAKSRVGDWEGDTLIGAEQDQVVVSVVESKFQSLCRQRSRVTMDNGPRMSKLRCILRPTSISPIPTAHGSVD